MMIFFYLFPVLFCFTTAFNTPITVGVLLMTNSTFPVDLPRVGPAIDMGIKEVYRRYGIVFEPIVSNYSVWCYKARYLAPGYLADLYYRQNVKAFIGPACSYAVGSAGRMAEYLRVPMVTGLGDLVDRDPGEKDMFETTAILSYNIRKLSVSVRALLHEYNWLHVSIIYDMDEVFYLRAGPSMVADFEADDSFPLPHPVPLRRSQSWDPRETLKDAAAHARVFIVLLNAAEFRVLMYNAHLLGMANGDYVFLVIQLAEVDWWGSYRNFIKDDEMSGVLKTAYESVLILSLINPVANNTEFQDEIKSRAARDYNYVFGVDEPVHYFITSFYEAVLYLGAAYNRSLSIYGNVTNGYDLARTYFGSMFEGLDQTVALDETGTRIADFEVLDMVDADREIFKRVGMFLGSERNYKPIPGTSIRWLKAVPSDKPHCGFTGELCIQSRLSNSSIGGIIGGCVALVLVSIIIVQNIISRRRAVKDVRWRVSWQDIEITHARGSTFMASGFSKSKYSFRSENAMFGTDEVIYGSTGVYKSVTVFIKKYKIESVELSANDIQEMRQLFQLRHNNLETFYGACVDTGHIAVLSEICPRGTLQDIIANDGIELDWSFRHSLIRDVVQGMRYLHHSEIRFHGNLTSPNCVVDSRFMLKIKGFGPKSFLKQEQKSRNLEIFANKYLVQKHRITLSEYAGMIVSRERRRFERDADIPAYSREVMCCFGTRYSDLLWTAPELLRLPLGSTGNQKGDVYSFAIILYEIIVRGEPYEHCVLSPEQIIQKVKVGSTPTFRPDVPNSDCSNDLVQMMLSCWIETPECRPSFDAVESSLKKVLKSTGSNIMDNLMRRMEQYANNLESLVEDRTRAYMDEKRKAEELLYRMLPVSVAKQLQNGDQVQPETYEGVTIYFSDIVGFTALAGQSTPMQVVDLLNDLYTVFDDIINNFHVYKVETIGDAYMCASGLPIRNDAHAQEISNMALSLRNSVLSFQIRHLPTEKLRIRIGLHSGSVVAGVVGLTMPRYCLFGDTVNTASRMESTGEAMQIHISESTMYLLETLGNYETDYRGETEIKGKGVMKTYWLISNCPDVPTKIAPKNVASLNV